MQHGLGERGYFREGQATKPCGHQPCRHLIVGNFAARVAGDQEIDLFAGEFSRIAFFSDQVNGAHV